ncbi:MAG TPA: hypothetical protein DCR40_18015 [Prolixibacteraceae bacterium]|nr:hypothetical protein [Prolixibacteraceae bacterium]
MGGIKPSAMSAATVVAFKAKLGDDSIVYKHPLGGAEYVGNATYSSSGSVYGLACIQKIVTDCRIKYIRVRMWGTSTTAGILRVYKSTSLGSGSQQFSANTLIEEIPVTAGNFNVNATGFHSVTLTNELNLNTNEYLFVYFLQTASTVSLARWTTLNGTSQERSAFLYTTNNNYTTAWAVSAVGASNGYQSAPMILEKAGGISAEALGVALATKQNVLTPRITIPATIHAVVGVELNLYSDAIILGTDCGKTSPKEYSVEYISTVGKSTERAFRYTAIAGDVGTKSLLIKVYDSNHTVVATKTVSLIVLANAAPSAVKRVLCVGDSLMNNGPISPTIQALFASLGSNIPLFFGTAGTDPAKHEGRSGWTYATFAGASSPFYSSGLNIAAYRTGLGMGADKFDIVTFQLGVNESFGVIKTEADRLQVIQYAKDIITAFLADNATTKIIVQLPTSDGNSKGGWAENYGTTGYKSEYQMNIWRLRELIISSFDAGAYNANVFVGIAGLSVDRYYGYVRVTQAVSARISDTEEVHNNAVHLATAGSQQVGDSYYATMRSFF